MLNKYFENFCKSIQINTDELEKWNSRIRKITKKLNKEYYDINSNEENMYVVGSVGRGTAVNNISDYDCIFRLPQEKFTQYNNYSNNGQSALLQEIKIKIQELYATTQIKGDGQVVVISFGDGDIELVPGFLNRDIFKYPDSNNGGYWKLTNPIPEISEAKRLADTTYGHYTNFCRLIRVWKNQAGFKFKGLLIDTLTKKFFESLSEEIELDYSNYDVILNYLFKYLSDENKDKSYWKALGSNQIITNNDNGTFIKKAKKAYKKLDKNRNDQVGMINVLKEIFGSYFVNDKERDLSPDEDLVEDKFLIDIRYNLALDYTVEQDGFRKKTMRFYFKNGYKLKNNKKLFFTIYSTDIPKYIYPKIKWYWKVKNIGLEARRRNEERGQIIKGEDYKEEHTKFTGQHYVECYAVLGNKVIARNRVNVPIDTVVGID